MAEGETFCLRLTEFERNIRATWQQLQIEKDFCDVTLACRDGEILTHKIVVSHSSPVLKNILSQHSNKNSVIYIRGVTYKYLECLVNFMYQGEVTVADKDLGKFLDVADDLKVRGLFENSRDFLIPSEEAPNSNGELVAYSNDDPPKKSNRNFTQNINQHFIQPLLKRNQNIKKSKKVPSTDHKSQIITGKRILMSESEKNNEVAELSNTARYLCDQCDNSSFSSLGNLRRHKVSVHDGVRFSCDQCNASPFTQAGDLKRHTASAHEGVRFSCNLCDTSPFTYAVLLKQHKAIIHEGVRYPCDQCDVRPFTSLVGLKYHISSAHEGIEYPCDQCDVKAFKSIVGLKYHKFSRHEGVGYKCNTCNYKAKHKSDLKQHIKKTHNI